MINTESKIGISLEEKQQIAKDLEAYVIANAGGSRNKASKMLKKVSVSYISQILNGKFEAMSDNAWRNLQKQVSVSYEGEWNVVSGIANYGKISHLFEDARKFAMTFGIIGNAGWGKTETAKAIGKQENVFLIRCNEYYNRKSFLRELMSVMGLEDSGTNIHEMMITIINHMRRLDHPLIIMDEVDKLSDQLLYFFISLYNALEGECGFVLMGAPFLQKRIEAGASKNKKGYKEIFSRLGGKFIPVEKPSENDIRRIINANGVHDDMTVARIVNDSNHDLRRVKRLVHAELRKQAA